MDRQVKGIWIPIEIWEAKDLSWNEKILLMEIDSFTSKGKDCYISNEYISTLLNITERCASRYMSNLIALGFVRVVKFDGRRRFVESTLTLFQADWNEMSKQDGKKVPHTNNKDIYKSSINIEDNNARKFDFKKELISMGVSPEVANAWMQVRKAKRATNTEIALNAIKREISKAGLTADQAIKMSVENSWSGFKADWIIRQKNNQPKKQESVFEHNMRELDKLFKTNNHEKLYGRKEADYDEQ